jgi:hypothetical protein
MLMSLGDDTTDGTTDSDSEWGASATGSASSGTLPLCSGITLPAGFVGPVNCDPSSGPPTYTVTTGASQASAAASAQAACSQAGGTFNASTGACAQSNATMYLVLGLGALITLLIATK